MSKGLSPVVATIVLIAFAVSIAGLMALWLTGFLNQTQEFTSEQGGKSIECGGVILKVESVTSDNIVYKNLNQKGKTVTNITVFDQLGRNLTFNASDLLPGQLSNAGWFRGNNTSISITGMCEKTFPVEGACKKDQECWE